MPREKTCVIRFATKLVLVAALARAPFSHAAGVPGNVFAWGDNTYGQTTVPRGLADVVRVAGGGGHTLALTAGGRVIAWGLNAYGQTNVPPDATNVVAIAATEQSSIALRNDGRIVVWGYKYPGGAEPPPDLTNVAAIAGGAHHGLALLSNGTVRAWGSWEYRQLEIPAGLDNVESIAAGGHLSAALRAGRVIYWGPMFPPVQISPEPTGPNASAGYFRKICVTEGYVLALREDNWCTQLPSLSRGYIAYDIFDLDAGVDHALFLARDGGIRTLGDNSKGQRNVPPALVGAQAIAAGTWHSLVVATAPLIERQPQSQILIEGEIGLLDVIAKSNGEITYEWGFRGGMIPGARSASLSLGPISTNVAGEYVAFVRDRYGSVRSSVAHVHVVRQIPGQTVSAGLGCSFRPEIPWVAPLTFQWQHNSVSIPGATSQELRLVDVQSTMPAFTVF